MTDIARKLAAPFDPDVVSWRVGPTNQDKSKGIALAYLDARDVMRRLDDVCGPFGWGCDHVVTGDMVTCHIRILDPETGIWVSKSDGAGKTDVEGEKGSYSDSLKRAAVQWSVGRYLYDVDSPWVPIEARGKSFIIPDSERTKLANLLRRKFPREAAQKPADDPYVSEAPEPRPNGKSAPAAHPTVPPAISAADMGDRPGLTERGGASSTATHGRTATSGASHSDRKAAHDRAIEVRDRIRGALGVATTPMLIDEIVDENAEDLQFLKEFHKPSFERLMQLAARLKTEQYAGTGD